MAAVRQFDLNQNSLAGGEYDDCEKMLAGDDADEPRRDRDGFLGKLWRRRSCPTQPLPPAPHPFELILQNPYQGLSIENLKLSVLYGVMIAALQSRARVHAGAGGTCFLPRLSMKR